MSVYGYFDLFWFISSLSMVEEGIYIPCLASREASSSANFRRRLSETQVTSGVFTGCQLPSGLPTLINFVGRGLPLGFRQPNQLTSKNLILVGKADANSEDKRRKHC